MPVLHSFDDTTPPARFDGVAWTRVLVEVAPDASTWAEIDDQAITPDPTPAQPGPIDVGVLSVLNRGYFRFRFRDAALLTSPYTAPVLSPSSTTGTERPTVAEVAILLRTRTTGGVQSTGLGADTGPTDMTTFTTGSRPTIDEVERVIDHALDEVLVQLPRSADAERLPGIRRVIALRAAGTIEKSFFREEAADLVAAYLSDLQALKAMIPREVAIAYGFSARELEEAGLRGVVRPTA